MATTAKKLIATDPVKGSAAVTDPVREASVGLKVTAPEEPNLVDAHQSRVDELQETLKREQDALATARRETRKGVDDIMEILDGAFETEFSGQALRNLQHVMTSLRARIETARGEVR